MSVEIIQERLGTYRCASALEEDQALREITQEIILAGLARTDFFSRVAFQGGTCLRIFHNLNRFSEDIAQPFCRQVACPLVQGLSQGARLV